MENFSRGSWEKTRTYDDGVRAGIKEQLESDLVEYASRIEILEEELDRIRKAKWVAVVKHRLCETHEGTTSKKLFFETPLLTRLHFFCIVSNS